MLIVSIELRVNLNDITLHALEFLLKELRQIHLAHKTYPLRVLLVGRWKTCLSRNLTHLFFEQMTYGEQCA